MHNDRPIANPQMQEAIHAFQALCQRYDLAGGCFFVDAKEMGFTYAMPATWNAMIPDDRTDTGFRIRVKQAEIGRERAQQLMDGTVWVFGAMCNFGRQTLQWGQDLIAMLRAQGMEITQDLPEVPHLEGRAPVALREHTWRGDPAAPERTGKSIRIREDPAVPPGQMRCACAYSDYDQFLQLMAQLYPQCSVVKTPGHPRHSLTLSVHPGPDFDEVVRDFEDPTVTPTTDREIAEAVLRARRRN